MSFKETPIGSIPVEWDIKKINDIAKIVDSLHQTPSYSNNGIPMVRVTDIKETGLELDKCLKVSEEIYNLFTRNHEPGVGDIVMSRVGTYGVFSYVKTRERFCIGQNTAIISSRINNKYLHYHLISTITKQQIDKMVVGSTQKTISLKNIKSILIPICSNREQQAIVATLSCLDDMIELNNRTNKILEEMAQAIFKRWFVDFEFPNEDGEPYKSSGGEMVDSELGEMPKGWNAGLLSKLIVVKYGKDHKKLADGNIPVYGSGGIIRYVNKPLYSSESVLIPRKGTLNNVIYVNEPFWSVDTMFFSEMKADYLAKFIYFLLKSKDLNSMNTGSAVPSMTTNVLNSLPVIIPPVEVLKQYNQIVSPMFTQLKKAEKENNILLNLRDTLLPKLMSGEIRVPVEEVV